MNVLGMRLPCGNILQGLKVTMKKHPSMLKVIGPLADRNNAVTDTAVTLYEGERERKRERFNHCICYDHI